MTDADGTEHRDFRFHTTDIQEIVRYLAGLYFDGESEIEKAIKDYDENRFMAATNGKRVACVEVATPQYSEGQWFIIRYRVRDGDNEYIVNTCDTTDDIGEVLDRNVCSIGSKIEQDWAAVQYEENGSWLYDDDTRLMKDLSIRPISKEDLDILWKYRVV